MKLHRTLWKKLTHTKALEQSSGESETLFFESVYRVAYITGLSTSDHSLLYKLYSNTVKLMIFLLVCGEVWFSFNDTLSMDEIVGSINATLIQFITIYRYKNMMDHKSIYKNLAVSMNSPNFDTSTEKRKSLVKFWAKRNEKYLKLLLALGNCTLAAWYIFPLVDDMEYNLIVGIRLPFTYNTSLRYPFAYILVVIAFTYISHFVMVTDLIMQAHLMHLLCQFTVLSDCFESLLADCRSGFEHIHRNYLIYNKSFEEKYVKRLGNLVEQHKLILKHTMDLRNTLSRPMLGQLAASGTLICFIGYQATTTITESFAKGLMSLLFLGYNGFELYIICRWCEEIKLESQRIGESIYSSGWESGMSLLPGVKSTIKLVMARANKPLVFTAGGMYDLSLTSYSNCLLYGLAINHKCDDAVLNGTCSFSFLCKKLVKTSYSALTVLLRFRHD